MALIAQRRAPETTDGRKAPQAAMHKELDKISFNVLEKTGIEITFIIFISTKSQIQQAYKPA